MIRFLLVICLLGWTHPAKTSVASNTAASKHHGTSKDFKDIKLCRIFKCLFVEMGCADTPLKSDDTLCRVNLYENLKKDKACPWKPCQGYDQPENHYCIAKNSSCPELEVPYGLCGQNMHCCSSLLSIPETLPLVPHVTDSYEPRRPATTTARPQVVRPSVSPQIMPPVAAHGSVALDSPKCLIPDFPNRRCIKGGFCSFDPAVKVLPHHACPDREDLCCETLL
ncbi:uncharacterized protein LOC106055970 isoform X2 [Biomphalaria glabrata]|uniref:Uncharacterized protein LOC106055970 isoform X2 n=1 Tax=Biomphalaria glabrata TaxID=6526 RepID=A0A9W2YJ51_BIOGL|nr:uncharacterized protein LOC106055970 isoform X2 [Biomphalaria glabrata]